MEDPQQVKETKRLEEVVTVPEGDRPVIVFKMEVKDQHQEVKLSSSSAEDEAKAKAQEEHRPAFVAAVNISDVGGSGSGSGTLAPTGGWRSENQPVPQRPPTTSSSSVIHEDPTFFMDGLKSQFGSTEQFVGFERHYYSQAEELKMLRVIFNSCNYFVARSKVSSDHTELIVYAVIVVLI
jgi:hypothetical protein